MTTHNSGSSSSSNNNSGSVKKMDTTTKMTTPPVISAPISAESTSLEQKNATFKLRNSSKNCYLSLACSIGSISLACGSLLQIPNTTDRISLQRGLFLTSLGFIYFVSLTDFCNKYLLETQRGLQFRKKYRLMMSDVLEITNKFVSAIQASFSFLVGFIVCKSTCSKSFVYASHFLMEAYGWFGTAYFMYDIWSMYKVHTQKIADKLKLMRLSAPTTGGAAVNGKGGKLSIKSSNGHAALNDGCGLYDKARMTNGDSNGDLLHVRQHESDIYDYDGEHVPIPKSGKWDFLKYVMTHPVMMVHHVFIGTFGLLVVTYIRGGGHCIYSYMFMMEFSTPFVSLRGILSKMRLKESRVYIYNGLAMLATFFICRVFMWPYVMWRYSIAIDATFWQAMIGLPNGCLISISILFLPQIYWFFLMVKGALTVFFPKSKPKMNGESNNLNGQQQLVGKRVTANSSEELSTANRVTNDLLKANGKSLN